MKIVDTCFLFFITISILLATIGSLLDMIDYATFSLALAILLLILRKEIKK